MDDVRGFINLNSSVDLEYLPVGEHKNRHPSPHTRTLSTSPHSVCSTVYNSAVRVCRPPSHGEGRRNTLSRGSRVFHHRGLARWGAPLLHSAHADRRSSAPQPFRFQWAVLNRVGEGRRGPVLYIPLRGSLAYKPEVNLTCAILTKPDITRYIFTVHKKWSNSRAGSSILWRVHVIMMCMRGLDTVSGSKGVGGGPAEGGCRRIRNGWIPEEEN